MVEGFITLRLLASVASKHTDHLRVALAAVLVMGNKTAKEKNQKKEACASNDYPYDYLNDKSEYLYDYLSDYLELPI